MKKIIRSALVSVFDKPKATALVQELHKNKVQLYASGGTCEWLRSIGIDTILLEQITGYPSILGGRVKTLHPKVFGGILNRSDWNSDKKDMQKHSIPQIDAVIVDLYPFEETVSQNKEEQEIIQNIDIGGISLIRAAAKNYRDTVVIAHQKQYNGFLEIVKNRSATTSLEERRAFAKEAFHISAAYDTAIAHYFSNQHQATSLPLRYGENPHQEANFQGNLNEIFEQLHGKALSYNNLLDLNSAMTLIEDFDKKEPVFAIIKHNSPCGVAQRTTILDAYRAAFKSDSISAFGGIFISNQSIDLATAKEIHKVFYEIVIAPHYQKEALDLLIQKKRIILQSKPFSPSQWTARTALNGTLRQQYDGKVESEKDFSYITNKKPTDKQVKDLIMAAKIVKHTLSNAIVLVRDEQLIGSGTGQVNRVDALKQAITKSEIQHGGAQGAVLASDAFFPFPDCVEIAAKAGIVSILQPGGSIKDNLSIDACNAHGISMVFTNTRHFKH